MQHLPDLVDYLDYFNLLWLVVFADDGILCFPGLHGTRMAQSVVVGKGFPVEDD